jgi:hypothetical protein
MGTGGVAWDGAGAATGVAAATGAWLAVTVSAEGARDTGLLAFGSNAQDPRSMDTKCGAPTRGGTACRWDYRECRFEHHRRWRREQGLPVPTTHPDASGRPAQDDAHERWSPPQELLHERDLRGLAWWLAEAALSGRVQPREAAVLGTLIRVLAALGPSDSDEEEALREIELRGLIAQGIAPRTDAEWALAAALFDDDALAELRHWPRDAEG